ncbi:MAG: GNAT family N-acetyltransferase [Pirellulales bacterium]|nr:GNAT family N-acetyltransferase [Pirellulales bacterium]
MSRVRRIADVADLSAMRDDWNRISGKIPFNRFEWNETWWRHYRDDGELYVLEVRDDANRVIGIAPWYLKRNAAQGRVLAFMASGEVCSDYQTILCEPGREGDVARALADWLSDVRNSLSEWVTREDQDRWDLIEWESAPIDDQILREVAQQLKRRGAAVFQRRSDSCWRLALTESWTEYEARLSKSHRKQVRRAIRNVIEEQRSQFFTATNEAELEHGFALLVKLHQRRWTTKGEAGVFASSRFTTFHKQMMWELLQKDMLRLHWLDIDGKTVAAEYCIAGEDVTYCYQGGVDPAELEIEPGRISKIMMLKAAREEGKLAFDMMRGDEPYKPHWRAEEVPCLELRIVARRAVSRLRNRVWIAGGRVKRMIASRPQDHRTEQRPRDWQKLAGALEWPEVSTDGLSAGV